MTTALNQAFLAAIAGNGTSPRFEGETSAFIWRGSEGGLFDALYNAVNDIRQQFSERNLHPGVRAARDGQEAIAAFIAKGGTFSTMRDSFGLDAGYYVARACLNYDFVALGEVERIGPLAHVEPLRYYNQSPTGPALFRAALGAGLKFTEASDSENRTAGFYVANCGDAELQALFRQAGGTFCQNAGAFLKTA